MEHIILIVAILVAMEVYPITTLIFLALLWLGWLVGTFGVGGESAPTGGGKGKGKKK